MAKVSENMVSQDYFGRGDYIGGFGGIKLFWVVSANFGRQQLEELQFYSNFCCVFLISQKKCTFVQNVCVVHKALSTRNVSSFSELHHRWALLWGGIGGGTTFECAAV